MARISKVVEELLRIKEEKGDIETTCTGSLLPDSQGDIPDIFETTVENFKVHEHKSLGTVVRLYM